MRTAIKKVSKAIESGVAAQAIEALKSGAAEVDGMVTKGLTHKNKAARHKSRLNKAIKAISQKKKPLIIVAEDVKVRLASEGAHGVQGMTPDAFNALVRDEIAMWRRIARERKISGET